MLDTFKVFVIQKSLVLINWLPLTYPFLFPFKASKGVAAVFEGI